MGSSLSPPQYSPEAELHSYSSHGFSKANEGIEVKKSAVVDERYEVQVGEVDIVQPKGWFFNFVNSFRLANTSDSGSEHGLQRKLKARHIQMIAIGGAIGTGVWVGSGESLASGGGASVLINYILVGTLVFFTVYNLGELSVAYPTRGSYITHATRFIDESWGFALSCNYAMGFLTSIPLELTTGTMLMRYWTDLNSGIWITVFITFLIFINMFGVRVYGEIEFFMSTIKVAAMVGFIILGIIINCGGVSTDHRGYIGTELFRENAFRNGFKGFCSVFTKAAFSFSCTECVGVAAAETDNPAKAFPKAVRQTFFRITIFYILSLFVVSLLISGSDSRLTSFSGVNASPFVLAIKDANIKALPSVLNAVILISVLSSANAMVYAGSRAIHSLGCNGFVPKCFSWVDRSGRPITSLLLIFLFMPLGYLVETGKSTTVFNWLLSLSGLGTFFTWGSINLAYIRYRSAMKHQQRSLSQIGFRSPFGIVAAWYAFGFICLILIAEFYVSVSPLNGKPSASSFFMNYLSAVIFLLFFTVHKVIYRTPIITSANMDIETDLACVIPAQVEDEKLQTSEAGSFQKVIKKMIAFF
ncbi:general amino acid permease GAP1 [Schizosaccharomyces octosporus yFS286]|uniref:General amino acid permease GAP1 n=1 Tax=Schizosaccharomyces octosporus (strain yFS286) TaxID=483514 RepID=S9RH33_SCHOY|nr:general amino acid permease GAP1 [Schizosaccharomyces octosporus yFS286]EPX73364.1 general amino acid permease GAP1 [Schizosaccharomyces octosporus yFS286]